MEIQQSTVLRHWILNIYHELSTSSNIFFWWINVPNVLKTLWELSVRKTHTGFNIGSLVIKKLFVLAKLIYMGNTVCWNIIINKKNNKRSKFQNLFFKSEILDSYRGKSNFLNLIHFPSYIFVLFISMERGPRNGIAKLKFIWILNFNICCQIEFQMALLLHISFSKCVTCEPPPPSSNMW